MRQRDTIRALWRKWEIYVLSAVILASFAFIGVVYGAKIIDEQEFTNIRDCISSHGHFVTCSQKHIEALLERHTAYEVMQELEKRHDPVICHTIAHNVGRVTYKKYKNIEPALSECSASCNMGCSHGVVGEAFITEAGLDDENFDPEHMQPEDIRKAGYRLCVSTAMCHGVGHALYQSYRQFAPALSTCRDVSSGRETVRCYRGVFMEYVDQLTIGGFRESGLETPDFMHPEKTCNQPTAAERQACFRYFGRITLSQLRTQGMSVAESNLALLKSCSGMPRVDRQACVASIGVNNTIMIFSDPAAAQNICGNFSDAFDREACTLGMVSSGIEYDHLDQVLAYCANINEEPRKASCYQYTFYSLNFAGYMLEPESRMLCREDLCRQGAERYGEDPWMYDET